MSPLRRLGEERGKKRLSQVLQLEQAISARSEAHKNPEHAEISFPQQSVCATMQENSPI